MMKKIDLKEVRELLVNKNFTDINNKINLFSDWIIDLQKNGYKPRAIWMENDGSKCYITTTDIDLSDYCRLIVKLN
jgi:hypothetical protein